MKIDPDRLSATAWLALASILPAALAPAPARAQSQFFEVTVREAFTQQPIPCATLTLTNDAVYTSDENGKIAFYEPGLMGQPVWFTVEAEGYSFPPGFLGFVGRTFVASEGGSDTIEGTPDGTAPPCDVGTDDTALLAGPVPGPAERFRIRMVDVETGRGVPLLELRSPAGSHWTDNAGLIAFHDPDLMGQTVSFELGGHGYDLVDPSGSVELVATPGGSAVVEVTPKPDQIAERLYRTTGAGRYRDSVLLGDTPPVPDPLINGLVMGQDSVNTAWSSRRPGRGWRR